MSRYFAYGSNMDPKRIGSSQRLGRLPRARAAWLTGYRLCFNKTARNRPGIGWANVVVAAEDDVVHGVLYDVRDEEMGTLDRIENGYLQQSIEVHLHDGTTVRALTYVACQGCTQDGLLPTPDYLDYLLAGKDYLPAEYVAALEKQPVRECE